MYEIYTTQYCGWCQRARALLRQRGYDYSERDVTDDGALQREMVERTGKRSVPQIFNTDQYIGGCDDLVNYLGQ